MKLNSCECSTIAAASLGRYVAQVNQLGAQLAAAQHSCYIYQVN